ncbi:MAG TPA: porin family protein [Candidatus Aminicenantes bacterium]|nr:porin family protein [Candidatus Aminicenantes bacterium]
MRNRKHRTVGLLAWVILVLPLTAGVRLGVKGGTGFASLQFHISGDEEWGTLIAPRGGVCAEFSLTGPLALETGAIWAPKGGRLEETWNGKPLRCTFRVEYLELPTLLKVVPWPNGKLRPALYGGGYLAPRLSAHQTLEYDGEQVEDDVSSVVRALDLGWLVGTSLDVRVGAGRLGLDARFQLGLSEVRGPASAQMRVTHRVFSLLLGYWF